MKCNFQNSNSQKNWWRYIYSPNSVSEYTERQRVIVSLRATCRSYWRNGEDGPANALRVLHWERERERERRSRRIWKMEVYDDEEGELIYVG